MHSAVSRRTKDKVIETLRSRLLWRPFRSSALGILFTLLTLRQAGAATTISGNIFGTLSLSSSPYVVTGNVTIPAGQSLSIESGVVIKLSLHAGILANGPVLAIGTSGAPIYFTSLQDDSVAGDTNGDGNTTSPAPGDWHWILLSGPGSAGSHFDHVIIRYAGFSDGVGLRVSQSTGTVFSNGEIRLNAGAGMLGTEGSIASVQNTLFNQNTGWGLISDGLTGNISGNVFDGNGSANGGGISFQGDGGAPVLSGNTFQNNRVVMDIESPNIYPNDQGGNSLGPNNLMAGIDIRTGWTSGGTWNFKSIPYVVRIPVLVSPGAPLTIGPGVVVKLSILESGATRFLIESPLTVLGTSAAPVYFTSLRDDSIGGDTNLYEGAGVAPAPGNWSSVYLALASASGSRLDHVIVRYGGANDSAELYLDQTSATVTAGDISRSATNGMRVVASTGLISGTTLQLNAGSGIQTLNAPVVEIHNSIILGNTSFGVENGDSSGLVNAQSNYWGSPTGPTHPSNPAGTGDKVSDGVNFTPFLTTPPNLGDNTGTAPLPPTGVTAAPGDTTVTISWTASSNSSVIGYNIYRDGNPLPLNINPLPPNSTTYRDIALSDGRTYHYVVTAVAASAESAPSPSVSATPVAGSGWGQ